MTKLVFTVWALVASVSLIAQGAFEGTLVVTYQVGTNAPTIAEIKVKGHQIKITQTQNGNRKYDYFIANTETMEFYTVSTADKKVAIRYDYEKLIDFYEKNRLKEGFKRNYPLTCKAADKTREEGGLKQTKLTCDAEAMKAEIWHTDTKLPLGKLIPLLRLIGNWNEAQNGDANVIEAVVTDKETKQVTTVKVQVKREEVSKDIFRVPKDYLVKDLGRIMDEDAGNGKLAVLVQTFTGF